MMRRNAPTGADALKALIANAMQRPRRAAIQSGPCAGTMCSIQGSSKPRTRKPQNLFKALRLMRRLGRLYPSDRPGNCAVPGVLPPPASRKRKRLSAMLAVVADHEQSMPKLAKTSCGDAILPAKGQNTIRELQAISAGRLSHVGPCVSVPAPVVHDASGAVLWAGLRFTIVRPLECHRCHSKNTLVLNRLGRYGPVGILDAATVHLALRQDFRCKACKKYVYCSKGDVIRHFAAEGIHAVVATSAVGRSPLWHTVEFVATLYSTLRHQHALSRLRIAYIEKLSTAAVHRFDEHLSISTAYLLSFLPAAGTLKHLIRFFHKYTVQPAVGHAQQTVAKRSRVWKVDGHRKAAKLVRGERHVKTAVVPIMNEEGCLVAPPVRVCGEGRQGFEEALGPALVVHMNANADQLDKGALVAMVCDDFEHCRQPLAEIWLRRWGDLFPYQSMSVPARIDALEAASLRGEPGFLVCQDVKHKDFDVTHHAPKASSSYPRSRDAFAAAQARFSAPPLPGQLHAARSRSRALPANAQSWLQRAVAMPVRKFQASVAASGGRDKKSAEAVRERLQAADVINAEFWGIAFGRMPPWTEIERAAAAFKAELHPSALPWGYGSVEEYVAELYKVKDWFVHVAPGHRRRMGIRREATDEGPGEPHIGHPMPCVNDAVSEILRRCERPVYTQGCLNWSHLCNQARRVGLEIASGTTDLEVLNSEIISIYRSGRIIALGAELFSIHMDLLFLRLVRRRSHAATRIVIAHGKDSVAQEFAITLDILRWFEQSEPAQLAAAWQATLDQQRSSDALVMRVRVASRIRMRLKRRRPPCPVPP